MVIERECSVAARRPGGPCKVHAHDIRKRRPRTLALDLTPLLVNSRAGRLKLAVTPIRGPLNPLIVTSTVL